MIRKHHRGVFEQIRAFAEPVPRRILPPRHRQELTLSAFLRGIFMLHPQVVCTVCGSREVRASSTALPRVVRWFGLSPYRCRECDHLLALPFRS